MNYIWTALAVVWAIFVWPWVGLWDLLTGGYRPGSRLEDGFYLIGMALAAIIQLILLFPLVFIFIGYLFLN